MQDDSPNNSDPVEYDEIMDRLRSNSADSGKESSSREVVVDEKTGEKKVRVKKRRRSSSASSKKSEAQQKESMRRWFNKVINYCWIILAAVALIAVVFMMLRLRKYEKPGFGQAIEDQLTNRTPGTVELSDLQLKWSNLYLNRLTYMGVEQELLETAEFRGVESGVSLRQLLGGSELDLGFLQVKSAEVLLQLPQGERASTVEEFGGPWEGPVPQEMTASHVYIDHLDVIMGESVDVGLGLDQLEQGIGEGVLTVDYAKRRFQLEEGDFYVQPFPVMDIESVRGGLSEDGSVLGIGRFTAQVRGQTALVKGRGELPMNGSGALELEFEVEDLQLNELFGEDTPLSERFDGLLQITQGRFSMGPQGNTRMVMEIDNRGSQFRFRNTEVFRELSDLLSDSLLLHPVVEDFQGQAVRSDDGWQVRIDEATLISGDAKASGEFRWNERDGLQGRLLVGVRTARLSQVYSLDERVAARVFTQIDTSDFSYATFFIEGDNFSIADSFSGRVESRAEANEQSGDSGAAEDEPPADTDLDDLLRQIEQDLPPEVRGSSGLDLDIREDEDADSTGDE